MLEGGQLENFTPTEERLNELKIDDIKIGEGEAVVAGQTITAHYTGARMQTGIIFQSSKDFGKAFTAPLNNLIAGWQTGIVGMKAGGVRRLSIPAAQAYGEDAGNGAPSGDLVFDIELISFN